MISEPASQEVAEEAEGPHVWVTLDGRAGAENVGILMAIKRGYFTDLGFSVAAGAPTRPRRPVEYVSDRTAQIGLSQEPQVLLAKEKRAPVVAVARLLPRPTLSMIWLRRSRIHEIRDLKEKTIGVPGIPYQNRLLRFVLSHAGLTRRDVHVKIVSYNLLRALENGQVDAIFGGSWNLEGAVLKERGLEPVILPVRRLGVPPYDELVVITQGDFAAKKARLIRRFTAAVVRGTAAAIADPQAAAWAIEASGEKGYGLSRDDIEAELEATLPLLSRARYMSRARTKHLMSWMRDRGLIQRAPPSGPVWASTAAVP